MFDLVFSAISNERAGGFFIAFACIIVLYAVTMGLYYGVRKRKYSAKYWVEVAFVAVAFLASWLCKLAILSRSVAGDDMWLGATNFFTSVYQGFGGFAFEGLSDVNSDKICSLLQMIYAGTSLYAGLVFVSVITTKASYEIYCVMKLWAYRAGGIFKPRDIYVFTAVTKDSVQLAQSIKRKYEADAKAISKWKFYLRKKAIIVFAGTKIGSFDKSNELHRKIMANDFLYVSYISRSDDKKLRSISRRLHLTNKNFTDKPKRNDKRFVVLALASDEKMIPMEEENMHVVYRDIGARNQNKRLSFRFCSKFCSDEKLKKIALRGDDKLKIEYYILTKRDINYQAYERKNREMLLEYLDANSRYFVEDKDSKDGKELLDYVHSYVMMSKREQVGFLNITVKTDEQKEKIKGIYNQLKKLWGRRFTLNTLSEVQLIATQASEAVVRELGEDIIKWSDKSPAGIFDFEDIKEFAKEKRKVEHENALSVWSLGFGSVGQAIAKELYVQTAYVNTHGVANRFFVDAFDSDVNNLRGLLCFENPMILPVGKETIASYIDDLKEFFKDDDKAKELLNKLDAIRSIRDMKAIIRKSNDAVKVFAKKELDSLMLNKKGDILSMPFVDEEYRIGYSGSEKISLTERTYDELIPMLICFNKLSCTEADFYRELDNVTGLDENTIETKEAEDNALESLWSNICTAQNIDSAKRAELLSKLKACSLSLVGDGRPDVIVISTGDDFRNIRTANALIHDIANEGKAKKATKQVILVTIGDSSNNNLLISVNGKWEGNRLEVCGGRLVVYVIGNTRELYSYNRVLNNDMARNYQYGYDLASGTAYSDSEVQEANGIKDDGCKERITRLNNAIGSCSGAVGNVLLVQAVRNLGIKCDSSKIDNRLIEWVEGCKAKIERACNGQGYVNYNSDLNLYFIIALTKEKEELEESKEELEESMKLLEKSKEKLTNSKEELEESMKLLEKSKEELTNSKEELEESMKDPTKSKEELEAIDIKIKETNEELKKTEDDLEKSKEKLEKSKEKLEKSKKGIEKSEKELKDKGKEINKIIEELKILKKVSTKSREEFEKSKKKLEDSKKDPGKSKEELEAIDKKINEIKKELKKLKDSIIFDKLFCDNKQLLPNVYSNKIWFESDIWLFESNRSACAFAEFMEKIYELKIKSAGQSADKLADLYQHMCATEHQRWMRLHLINGWRYSANKKKDELLKKHNCIAPCAMIAPGTMTYDMINVIWAIRNYESKKGKLNIQRLLENAKAEKTVKTVGATDIATTAVAKDEPATIDDKADTITEIDTTVTDTTGIDTTATGTTVTDTTATGTTVTDTTDDTGADN